MKLKNILTEATAKHDQQFRANAEKTLANIAMAFENNQMENLLIRETEDSLMYDISSFIATDIAFDEDIVLKITFDNDNPYAGIGKASAGRDIVFVELNVSISKPPKQTRSSALFHYIANVYSLSLIHEFIHLFDHARRPNFFDDPTRFRQDGSYATDEDYYNHPSEFNAYFQEGMWNLMDYMDTHEQLSFDPSDFDESFDFFVNDILDQDFVSYLTDKNFRKIQKRFYQSWKELIKP